MKIEHKNNIIYFNNDDCIAYGYVLDTKDGYRMAFYAGIVISGEEIRQLSKELTMFVNKITLS